jgi:hypothetical protein
LLRCLRAAMPDLCGECWKCMAGIVRRLLWRGGGAAMTFGHVILGRNQACLDRSRAHELVHVRQFERWGPLLLPLYVLAGWEVWRRGLDPHLDNPFELEAYEGGGEP